MRVVNLSFPYLTYLFFSSLPHVKVSISIDDATVENTIKPNDYQSLTLDDQFYVGGRPERLQADDSTKNFVGCLKEVIIILCKTQANKKQSLVFIIILLAIDVKIDTTDVVLISQCASCGRYARYSDVKSCK